MENKKLVEPGKEERAQLKKLMDSHALILEHRLGRPPTMDELVKFAQEGGEEESTDPTAMVQGVRADAPLQEGEPAILGMKVVYGMSGEGEERKPDPEKILFYRTPDNRWYDTSSQAWCPEPSYASHLPSREINFNEKDLVSAIAHGVMEDQDYEALDKAGMITELPKQLWTKVRHLKTLKEQLEKSTPIEESDIEELNVEPVEGEGEAYVDNIKEILSTAGVEEGTGEEQTEGEAGEDLIAQIMEAAMSVISENIEQQVTDIIHKILLQYGLIIPASVSEQDIPESNLTKEAPLD